MVSLEDINSERYYEYRMVAMENVAVRVSCWRKKFNVCFVGLE